MLEIHLPKESDKYVKDNVLKIHEDCILYIDGRVELKQILLLSGAKNFKITGLGHLIVDASEMEGIAIGNNANFGLSFGRYSLPSNISHITIDVRSITTECSIPGCGIGSFGCYAIQSSDFTSNCTLRNTPIDYTIVLEKLSASTKYSALPQYLTNKEYEALTRATREKVDHMLMADKIVTGVIDKLKSMCETGDNMPVSDFMLTFGLKYMERATKENFVELLQSMTATYLKAIPIFDPSCHKEILYHLVYVYAAIKEAEVFDRILRMPLSMRYLSCIMDMCSDFRLFEDLDPKIITDCHDLNLPEDNIYGLAGCTKKLRRTLFGLYQIVNYNDDCNEVIEPEVKIENNIIYTNFYIYSAMDMYMHRDATYKGLVLCFDKPGDGDGCIYIGDSKALPSEHALPLNDRQSVNVFIKFLSGKGIVTGISFLNYMNKFTSYSNVMDIEYV